MIFRALYFHLFASQIMLALALPPSPNSNFSSLLLFIGNCKRLVVAGFSPLSLSSCYKHRLTIQLFFIFLFCLLQSSTAAAAAAHPSGWGSVATTTLKKINLHAASSARPRWQHCIKHTNTHTHTHTHARERGREHNYCCLYVAMSSLSHCLSLLLLLFAQVKLFPKMWMTVNSLSAAR